MLIRTEEGCCDFCGTTDRGTVLLGRLDAFICGKCYKDMASDVVSVATITVETMLVEQDNATGNIGQG